MVHWSGQRIPIGEPWHKIGYRKDISGSHVHFFIPKLTSIVNAIPGSIVPSSVFPVVYNLLMLTSWKKLWILAVMIDQGMTMKLCANAMTSQFFGYSVAVVLSMITITKRPWIMGCIKNKAQKNIPNHLANFIEWYTRSTYIDSLV